MIEIDVKHKGKTYRGEVGTIENTHLGFQDHGLMVASLTFKLSGGGHISVGDYRLDNKGEGSAYGLDYILQLLAVVGVDRWESLKGKQVVVLFDGPSLGSRSVGLASLTSDKVFIMAEHAEEWGNRE